MRWSPDRLLVLTGGDYAVDGEAQLACFARLFLVHMAARDWVKLTEHFSDTRLCLAVGFTLCLVLALTARSRIALALRVALGLAIWKLAWNFPDASNHYAVEFLALVALNLFSLCKQEEREPLVSLLRWLPAWALLFSGIHKVLYGTYVLGTFLTTLIPQDRFALVFSYILPSAELLALSADDFAGPYRFTSITGLLVANAVYVAEIGVGVLLLVRRWRRYGVILGLALLLAIEAGAREIMFGLLMTSLLLLNVGEPAIRRFFAPAVVAYAYLVLGRVGLVPVGWFN